VQSILCVSLKTFSSRIPVVRTVLNVDAGGYDDCTALLSKGLLGSASNLAYSEFAAAEEKRLESYQGYETIARISPVAGFNTTTDPILLPRAF
jgi:hypothetical protein